VRDKNSSKIKIHFIGYSNEHDEWRDADQLQNDEKLALGRYTPRFLLSNQSLEDRAGAMFCGLARKIKFGLFSSKRESPEVRIEACIDMDIYQAYLADIGVVKKSRERNVHCLNENDQLCNILGNKWCERLLNINGEFCYVVAGTVRFWIMKRIQLSNLFTLGINFLKVTFRITLNLYLHLSMEMASKYNITLIHGSNIDYM